MPFDQILRVHDISRKVIVHKNMPKSDRRDVANRNHKNNPRNN